MTVLKEANSIVEMAEWVRIAQQRILTQRNVKPDDAASIRGILQALPKADFYEIDHAVSAATDQLFEAQFSGRHTEDIVLDADCRLPSPICVFWAKGSKVRFADYPQELPFMYVAIREGERVAVYLASNYFSPLFQGGYETEVEDGLIGPDEGDDEDKTTRAMHTLTVAALCSIINQPNFTKSEPVGTRQTRRAANRAGGYALDAWHRITWNIGEEVRSKLTRDDPVRCMPLHYTRGHWRRAQEGFKGATQRKDGGWYQWIDGYWSGHPAFGVKRAYHAPQLKGAAE